MVPQNWPSDEKKTTKAWNLLPFLFCSFTFIFMSIFLNFLALYHVGDELNKVSLVGEWHYNFI